MVTVWPARESPNSVRMSAGCESPSVKRNGTRTYEKANTNRRPAFGLNNGAPCWPAREGLSAHRIRYDLAQAGTSHRVTIRPPVASRYSVCIINVGDMLLSYTHTVVQLSERLDVAVEPSVTMMKHAHDHDHEHGSYRP